MVEDGGGVAEDEVDAALDIGVDVVLAAVVGEERVLMAEEAAVLEDGAVGANSDGDGLTGVAGGVFEGEVVGFETGAVDLDGFRKEGAASLFGIQAVGDDDVFGRVAGAEKRDVGVVLRDVDALMIRTGRDLDEDATAATGPGMMVERHLDGGEFGGAFDAGLHVGGDANVDVLGVERGDEKEGERQKEKAHWGVAARLRHDVKVYSVESCREVGLLTSRAGIVLLLGAAIACGSAGQAQTALSDGNGAYATGNYRNLFKEDGHSEKQIRAKIDAAYQQLFHGDPQTQAVAFAAGSNANGPLMYLTDWANHDVRTEGMSYGMMITVELNQKAEFDALWNWAMTYMYDRGPQGAELRVLRVVVQSGWDAQLGGRGAGWRIVFCDGIAVRGESVAGRRRGSTTIAPRRRSC